jgi:signal peptidase I
MDGIPPLDDRPSSPTRRTLTAFLLAVTVLLLLRGFFLEPFQVPTGSMAPALLGHHRTGTCPRCGFVVRVGRTHADHNGAGGERCYAQAFCPNCGCADLHLGEEPETQGDHVLVDKTAFALRRPRRWEVVVFRLFGKTFIKRLIGLGGEEIELIDGDVYVDGRLARKTFDEFLGMRVLVFDNDFGPEPDGWKDRWEYEPAAKMEFGIRQPLSVDGQNVPQKVTYRNYSLDERKCQPILDEYAYNGANRAEPVRDFMVEAEVEVVQGRGALCFGLRDGGVAAEVALAVGEAKELQVRLVPPESPDRVPRTNGQKVGLLAGKRYHIEMALVDRRLTVRVDGRDILVPLDLSPAHVREPVDRPWSVTARGVLAELHHVRLYRDVHYTQIGKNAMRGRAARLGIGDIFVLGDNSPNSEDSRFWPDGGAVPAANLIGRAFLVHLPSRAVSWRGWGREWQYQLPDWERVRIR